MTERAVTEGATAGDGSDGVYVYAVGRDLPAHIDEAVRGVAGAPVRVVAGHGLSALVSTVSLSEFGERALRENLEDLDWLEATARAHHAVVDAAAAAGTALPLRLVTVYRSDERVREVLDERAEEFTRALGRITGRTEWGVKAYADLREFTPDEPAGTAAEGAAESGPGTSYLRRRRVQRDTDERSRDTAMSCAGRVDSELGDLAEAVHAHPPQDPQLSGHEGFMILNSAYLVDDTRAEEFRAAVDRLSGLWPGIRLELTGPWAPYSFATEDEPWRES